MHVTLDLNDTLLKKAKEITNIESDKVLIERALDLLIRIENQKLLSDLWGKVEVEENFD